jgi:hypothetical protein
MKKHKHIHRAMRGSENPFTMASNQHIVRNKNLTAEQTAAMLYILSYSDTFEFRHLRQMLEKRFGWSTSKCVRHIRSLRALGHLELRRDVIGGRQVISYEVFEEPETSPPPVTKSSDEHMVTGDQTPDHPRPTPWSPVTSLRKNTLRKNKELDSSPSLSPGVRGTGEESSSSYFSRILPGTEVTVDHIDEIPGAPLHSLPAGLKMAPGHASDADVRELCIQFYRGSFPDEQCIPARFANLSDARQFMDSPVGRVMGSVIQLARGCPMTREEMRRVVQRIRRNNFSLPDIVRPWAVLTKYKGSRSDGVVKMARDHVRMMAAQNWVAAPNVAIPIKGVVEEMQVKNLRLERLHQMGFVWVDWVLETMFKAIGSCSVIFRPLHNTMKQKIEIGCTGVFDDLIPDDTGVGNLLLADIIAAHDSALPQPQSQARRLLLTIPKQVHIPSRSKVD